LARGRHVGDHADTGGVLELELFKKVSTGMSYHDVRAMCGPPLNDMHDPTYQTLRRVEDDDVWLYQSPRYDMLEVHFKDGKVSNVVLADASTRR
jgi:hypothetical protein